MIYSKYMKFEDYLKINWLKESNSISTHSYNEQIRETQFSLYKKKNLQDCTWSQYCLESHFMEVIEQIQEF